VGIFINGNSYRIHIHFVGLEKKVQKIQEHFLHQVTICLKNKQINQSHFMVVLFHESTYMANFTLIHILLKYIYIPHTFSEEQVPFPLDLLA
jgi:hypothetical protein